MFGYREFRRPLEISEIPNDRCDIEMLPKSLEEDPFLSIGIPQGLCERSDDPLLRSGIEQRAYRP